MANDPTVVTMLNPFSAEYQHQQLILTLKGQADAANANAAAAYLREAQDWLINAVSARDSGRQIPTLADPPLKIHVNDAGEQVSGPEFVASKPMLPAPVGVPSTGLIANPSAPPDRIDQLLNGMSVMFTEIMAIKAKLNA